MAATATSSATDLRQQLDDVIECPICTGVFVDPRVLPCIHSYCLKCITECCKEKPNGDKAACPLCRKEFVIPDKGVGELPKNFFLAKLLNIRELSTTQHEVKLCDICCSDESVLTDKTATMYCLDCQQKLCAICHFYHTKFKQSIAHKAIKLGDKIEKEELYDKCPPSYCEKHAEKYLEIYCFDCKTASCMMCYIELHSSHKCSDINKVADEFRAKITKDVERMSGCCQDYLETLKSLDDDKTSFAYMIKEVEKKVRDRAQHLHSLIDLHKDMLLSELDEIRKTRIKEMENIQSEIEQHLKMLESFKKYVVQVASVGTASDIVREDISLQARLNELLNTTEQAKTSLRIMGSIAVSFDISKVNMENKNATIGKIITKSAAGEHFTIPTRATAVIAK